MTLTVYLATISTIGTIFTLGWAVYLHRYSILKRAHDANLAELQEMNNKIRVLELEMARQTSPLMKQVQDLLSAGLHHPDPDHVRADALLEKLDKVTLTAAELPELNSILEERISDPKTSMTEIQFAKAIKALMPLVVQETAIAEKIITNKKL